MVALAYYALYHLCMTGIPDTDFGALGFFLADYATVESGKVYASGGFWNRLRFTSFPATYTFSVVAVLSVPWRANHQLHDFRVKFIDADGTVGAGELAGEIQVGAPPEAKVGDPTVVPVAATVNNFTFERPGDYAAVLEIDGSEISRSSFRALQSLQASGPSGSVHRGAPADPS